MIELIRKLNALERRILRVESGTEVEPVGTFLKKTGDTGTGAYILASSGISVKPLIVRGFTGQLGSASLQEWQDSTGFARASIDKNGIQKWFLNSGISDVGSLQFSTPGGSPGIIIYTGATYNQDRFDIANKAASGFGFGFNADDGGNPDSIFIKQGSRVGFSTQTPSAKHHIKGTSDEVQQIIQANTTQTANTTEWKDSSGTAGAIVDANQDIIFKSYTDATRPTAGKAGRVIFNTTDGQLNVDDGTNWTLPDGTTT